MNHHLFPEPFVRACISNILLNEQRSTPNLGGQKIWAVYLFPMRKWADGKMGDRQISWRLLCTAFWCVDTCCTSCHVVVMPSKSTGWSLPKRGLWHVWRHSTKGRAHTNFARNERVSFQLLTSANLQWHLVFLDLFCRSALWNKFCSHKSLLKFSCKQQTQFFLSLTHYLIKDKA